MGLLGESQGLPAKAAYVDPRLGDIRDSLADISAAQEAIGYEPTVTFEDGLARTVASLARESAPSYQTPG